MPYSLNECGCNICPEFAVRHRTRSASLTKCGWPEFAGYESTPPKIYRTKTLAGSIDYRTFLGPDCEPLDGCHSRAVQTFSGAMTYPRSTCEIPESAHAHIESWAPCDTPGGEIDGDASSIGSPTGNTSEAFSSTVHTISGLGCGEGSGPSFYASGSQTETLSDEYTKAQLIEDTVGLAEADSFGTWFGGTPDTFLFDLSSDEATCTVREVQVEVRHRVPPNGLCYRFKYHVYFVPEGGGFESDIVSETDYVWDQVVPDGYDPNDEETWPKFEMSLDFALLEVALPALPEGEIVIEVYDYTCEGCE